MDVADVSVETVDGHQVSRFDMMLKAEGHGEVWAVSINHTMNAVALYLEGRDEKPIVLDRKAWARLPKDNPDAAVKIIRTMAALDAELVGA